MQLETFMLEKEGFINVHGVGFLKPKCDLKKHG
jgi:hypothetical protein